jgi:hypothetical protein
MGIKTAVRRLLTIGLAAGALLGGQGPFGFRKGMTREEAIRLVGAAAVNMTESTGDWLEVSTAPNPHPGFESYTLGFSPTQGLVKIIATGRNIQSNGFGAEIREAFERVRDALTAAYGKPDLDNFLLSGSIWNEPQDWTMGLRKKERVLAAYWLVSKGTLDVNNPGCITGIKLEAVALSSEVGYLDLNYEFQGFHEYLTGKRAQENNVF